MHLEAVVRPRAELEDARLLVEGEVLDVDLAARLVNGRRFPLDQAAVVHRCLGGQRHLEVPVGAKSPYKRLIDAPSGRFTARARELESETSGPLLVVQHDIRTPDVLRRDVEHIDAAVIRRVPLQLVVVPILHVESATYFILG